MAEDKKSKNKIGADNDMPIEVTMQNSDNTLATASHAKDDKNRYVKKDEIDKEMPIEVLMHEFDYARETASQAMDDRHKMVNSYLIYLTGAVLTGIINILTNNSAINVPSFNSVNFAAFLFFTIFIAGFLYVMKLAFLRVAWYDSVIAMNKIKDYYCKDHKDFNIVFRWTSDSLKNQIKLDGIYTVSFLSAGLIILLNSFMFAAGLYILNFLMPIFIFCIFFSAVILQIIIYKMYVKNRKEKYDRQY